MTPLPPPLIAAAEDVAGMTRGSHLLERGSNPPRDPAVAAAACRLLGIEDLRQYRPYRPTARYVVRLADRSRLDVSSEVHALVRLARHGLTGNAPGEVREILERLRQRGGERAVKAVQRAVRQAVWAVARPAAEVERLLEETPGPVGRAGGEEAGLPRGPGLGCLAASSKWASVRRRAAQNSRTAS